MVKGNTRKVIVVKSPDPKLFEEAIFFLRDDAAEKIGVTQRELMEEACRAAERYSRQKKSRKSRKRYYSLFWAAAGAVAVAAVWLSSALLF